jgi:O-antigen ligase
LPFSVPNAMPLPLAGSSLLLLGGGVVSDSWLLTDLGLGLLAWVGLHRPVLWTGALLFGLPFYLYSLPILPTRALNLIEIGIWGGWVVLAGHWTVDDRNPKSATSKIDVAELVTKIRYSLFNPHLFLAAIIMLALIAVFASAQQDVALREWRTIFLSAGGFALLLAGTLATEPQRHSRQTLLSCWLLGGTTIAMVGLWQYASGRMLIEAEGVERVRAFYGSPNNLALYLDRTIAVTLALALFEDSRKTIGDLSHSRFFWWLLALPQLAALLLTFSKGSLVLALPAMLSTLGVGGYILLRQRGDSLRPLWGLAAVAMGMLIGLLPFIEAERFRSLADFSAGTTGGVRLNLWRSSLHMALDHPLLGVGPDNFLYAYRSNYILPAAWQDPDLNHPHNVVLDWWTRLGLGGLLLAMGWLLAGGRRLWRNLLAANHAALSLGCLAAVAAGLAHGLIDASYALPDLMLVWVLLLGLIDMKGHIQCNH